MLVSCKSSLHVLMIRNRGQHMPLCMLLMSEGACVTLAQVAAVMLAKLVRSSALKSELQAPMVSSITLYAVKRMQQKQDRVWTPRATDQEEEKHTT